MNPKKDIFQLVIFTTPNTLKYTSSPIKNYIPSLSNTYKSNSHKNIYLFLTINSTHITLNNVYKLNVSILYNVCNIIWEFLFHVYVHHYKLYHFLICCFRKLIRIFGEGSLGVFRVFRGLGWRWGIVIMWIVLSGIL